MRGLSSAINVDKMTTSIINFFAKATAKKNIFIAPIASLDTEALGCVQARSY